MSVASEATTKVKELLGFGEQVRKFGTPSGLKREKQKCEFIRTYMRCRGLLSTEKKQVELPLDSTLKDARQAFGREMRQQKTLDEGGYEIENPLRLLASLSNNCNVNLIFAYSAKKEVEKVAVVTEKATTATIDKVAAVTKESSKAARDVWNSIRDQETK